MAYMQRRRLTTESDISGTSTWRFKLPRVGKFTALEIVLSANRYANRASVNTVFPLETQVTKIELLEASTRPLVSLTGEQLDVSNYWTLGRPNPRRYRQLADRDNIMTWYLLPGRDLYDKSFGYDFAKLGETYLEFTHALTADAAEKFDVSTTILSLYAWQWMGPDLPTFTAYFRSRQLAYWTTSAADTLKTIEIPLGNKLRRIGVQAGTRASTIGGTIKELEVVVNDGEYSPVHIKSPMHHVMSEVQEYNLHNVIGGLDYLYTDAGHDLPYWFSYYQHGQVSAYASVAVHPEVTSLIQIPATIARTAGNDGEVVFSTHGFGFQKCLRIGFDKMPGGFDLLPTARLGALDLVCTEAAASKAARVFVQDLVKY